ncbi:MAG: sugar ABC transporter permease [Firmicutes bacterium]|nr:sugar ABC transporter permease [Bacillota bacterium]
MDRKTKHILKGVASGILPGTGQLLNRQYIKAVFFFIFFAMFVFIEISSSHYFSQVNPYDKLTSETGELYSDDFAKNFYNRYLFDKADGKINLPDFETYHDSAMEDDIFSMQELIDYAAIQIIDASTARYFLLIPDLVTDGSGGYKTANDGVVVDTDLIIGVDDDAIAAMTFRSIVQGVSIYEQNNVEYYKVITGDGVTREEFYVNVNNPTDIIYDVTGFTVSTRTSSLYLNPTTDVIYIKSTTSSSVLGTSTYRYTNITDSSDFIDATDTGNTAEINALKSVVVKGTVLYDTSNNVYVRYIPEINYEMVHGYNGTEFTYYLRNYITSRSLPNANTDYDSGYYNRFLLEVYFSVNPDLRDEFESTYYNFFFDKAGFFLKGLWSVVTLGTTEKVTYEYKSLHDPLKSVAFTDDGVTYGAVAGILDESPLLGHVSSYLLIQGLISTLLMAYFIFIWIWSVTDASKTSKKYDLTHERVTDGQWFKDIYTHGFEYIMIFPAVFVITFISIMPILFGFLIAFTSYSGFDSDSGLFTWVGFYNFTRIFSFGEGIPFGETFWRVFVWTVIWAIFSTATVFFGGMFQAIVISSERVPFKKFWRTFLILPWAVPALISQMAFSVIFSDKGVVNAILKNAGLIDLFQKWGIISTEYDTLSGVQQFFYLGQETVQWFTNANNIWFVRIALIVINIWLGAPYFMALMTSIMTSIDKTLYEAADIDGASKGQKFKFITFPLVMYSTAPILVMTFSGNFNNFGVIYFITQGGTGAGDIDSAFAGSTDILISWMYTLTVSKKVYNMASVFSILIFIIVGSVAAWNYSQMRAFKED